MPKLLLHQSFYLDAFYTLSEWRGYIGTGNLAPVSMQEVLVYCEMFDIRSLALRETLLLHIKHLDRAYMRKRAERLKDTSSEKSDT